MRKFTKTKDRTLIKKWAEDRHGKPAISIQGNDQEEGSLLRIKFDDDEKNLVTISWTEFFSIFDEHNLTFAYEQNNIPALPTYFKNWLKHNTGIQWSSTTQLWKQLYDRIKSSTYYLKNKMLHKSFCRKKHYTSSIND